MNNNSSLLNIIFKAASHTLQHYCFLTMLLDFKRHNQNSTYIISLADLSPLSQAHSLYLTRGYRNRSVLVPCIFGSPLPGTGIVLVSCTLGSPFPGTGTVLVPLKHEKIKRKIQLRFK